MKTLLRMYICELLLGLILRIVPDSYEGTRLVLAIRDYTVKSLEEKLTNKN